MISLNSSNHKSPKFESSEESTRRNHCKRTEITSRELLLLYKHMGQTQIEKPKNVKDPTQM